MLWWFIGVWLASGAVLPVCWLLSMAYRAASKKIGPEGLYVLSGLVSIGALILLFVSPFCDSNITMRDIPPASAVAAQAPVTSAAGAEAIQLLTWTTLSPSSSQFSAKPAQTELLDAAEQVASSQPRIHRGSAHRRTSGPPVRAYVTQLSHGTWLFPPNQTGGG